MSPRTPSNDRGTGTTRERILDAALELFGTRGFAATTTKEIAKRAGVNEVTIFRTFRSKQALYVAVFAERSLVPSIVNAVVFDFDTPVDEMIERNMRTVLDILKSNRHMFMALLSDAWRQPKARKMIGEGAMAKAVAFLSEMLERQMDAGRLRRTDPEIAARAIVGMVQAYFLTTYLLQGEPDDERRDDRYVKGFVSVLLDGMRPRGDHSGG